MDSDKDAEIARLKEELRIANSAFRASDLLIAEIKRLEFADQRRRRADGYRIPSGIYELLEDIGILEAARCGLMRLWHKDEPEFRKMLMHLSKLQWDLREKVRKNL